MASTTAATGPAQNCSLTFSSASMATLMSRKFSAVMGDMRPVRTAPNMAGSATSHSSTPRLTPLKNSKSFPPATIPTTANSSTAIGLRNLGCSRSSITSPNRVKASAVLGAMGM